MISKKPKPVQPKEVNSITPPNNKTPKMTTLKGNKRSGKEKTVMKPQLYPTSMT